jgi:putative ABC transport system permease protein
VLGLHLLNGRNFNAAIASDTVSSVIVNEAMVEDLGWTMSNAVGQPIRGYYDNENDPRTPVVIGVVKNFNYLDMRQTVQPQMFQQFPYYSPQRWFVRMRPGNPSKALSALEATWKRIAPDYPLQYDFLDESLGRFYRSEERWSHIVGWAGGVSIFLACLGLFGLVALASVNRTKEISIRKVLGASVSTIIGLLSKDFLLLVAVALLIAAPLVGWLMNKWLQGYAYRVGIGWGVFVLTGAIIVGIALLTLCLQAVKAALANPVRHLRTE